MPGQCPVQREEMGRKRPFPQMSQKQAVKKGMYLRVCLPFSTKYFNRLKTIGRIDFHLKKNEGGKDLRYLADLLILPGAALQTPSSFTKSVCPPIPTFS